mmetsp:Transcript_3637/g.8797  ORF Transcript_3637/g.8797 Transcript_3637/m.8797 type:complete len:287 (+) Transcript_3637:23-883(+)
MGGGSPYDTGMAGSFLRVLSFNIRYDNPADGLDSWDNRKHDVVKFLLDRSPHVIGLQEVLPHQNDFLVSALTNTYSYYSVPRDDGYSKGESCTIFVHKSFGSIGDAGTFWFGPTPFVPGSRHPDASLPRICSWVRIELMGTLPRFDRPVFVLNLHLDHASVQARTQAATQLLATIPAIAGLYPSVLMGDFNCEPQASEMRVLKSCGYLASALPDDLPHIPTFTGFNGEGAGQIDHVLVSGLRCVSWCVGGTDNGRMRCTSQPLITAAGRRLSDHLPVEVELEPNWG